MNGIFNSTPLFPGNDIILNRDNTAFLNKKPLQISIIEIINGTNCFMVTHKQFTTIFTRCTGKTRCYLKRKRRLNHLMVDQIEIPINLNGLESIQNVFFRPINGNV